MGFERFKLRSVGAELKGSLAVALSVSAFWLLVLPAVVSFRFAYVPSESMAPTLHAGDLLLAERNPKQLVEGDIVLFNVCCSPSRYSPLYVPPAGAYPQGPFWPILILSPSRPISPFPCVSLVVSCYLLPPVSWKLYPSPPLQFQPPPLLVQYVRQNGDRLSSRDKFVKRVVGIPGDTVSTNARAQVAATGLHTSTRPQGKCICEPPPFLLAVMCEGGALLALPPGVC